MKPPVRWLRMSLPGRWGTAVWLALSALWWVPAQAQPTATAQPAAADLQRRVALVIGNNGYDSAPLVNSVNDARAMAVVLREAGFAVTLLADVDQRQFMLALREFGERLKVAGSGGAGLFYFAGHGVQIKGRNFLIPVRSQIAHEDEVAYAAVDAQAVLDKMESAGNGTNIVILDACRNNPFARSLRSGQQGLAQMDAPVGTLVAYATAPGAVAVDSGANLRNGLYTTHLLEAIRRPGLKVEDVMKQVRNAVLRASGNKQMPWEASALVGDFYFHPPREGLAAGAAPAPAAALAPAGPPAVDTQAAIDDALWDAVKDSRSSAELYAYLQRFPNGRHARDARRRLLDLAAPGAPAGRITQPSAPESAPSLPGLPAPPPRQALPAGAGPIVAPAGSDTVEQTVRWGPHGADRRPENPKRNSAGFAEGDRFRYQKTDHFVNGSHGVTDYLWTLDRIEADGSLWFNSGRQRFDALGQRSGGNDEHTGMWVDYSPPLPIAEAARRGAGVDLPVASTVTVRDVEGRIENIRFTGTLRTHDDTTRGPRGMVDLLRAVRVEVELAGQGVRTDGARRQLRWVHTYYMALPLLLPVSVQIIEVADGLPRQNTRHDLIAVDQLSLLDAVPGGGAADASPSSHGRR
jgi:uncharacterized caspase-like protein